MTIANLIEILGAADPREIAEIRRLLGVPSGDPPLQLAVIGPGQDNYGRGHDETTSRLVGSLKKDQT